MEEGGVMWCEVVAAARAAGTSVVEHQSSIAEKRLERARQRLDEIELEKVALWRSACVCPVSWTTFLIKSGSKGAAGHDNVTFEGGFVIFVCQVPWTPGKVPSTPAVLRCPSARWIAPFSAGVAPFSPNRTPICEWLRLLPKALRPLPMVCVLFPGISKGYAAPRPYRGSGALWNAGWG